MNSTTETTLAEIVNHEPRAARLFESIGLDYCCGGGHTVAVACAERGLDPTDVLGRLAALGPAPEVVPWAGMAPDELVDHIEATHHAFLRAELDLLATLMAKVVSVHSERHPELRDTAATLQALRADLEPHLDKEEQVLFPMIRELAAAHHKPAFHCGSVRNPISVMLAEHDRVGELLAQLRSRTEDFTPPADGCASYEALYRGLAELESDTHLHVHKENNLLFPAVVGLEEQLPD